MDDPRRSGLTRTLRWILLVVAVLYASAELLVMVGILALCIVGGIATRSVPLASFGVIGELALIGYGAVEARRRRTEQSAARISSRE